MSWGDLARGYLEQYPEQQFMAEDVRAWAYNQGLEAPASDRAWGAVMTKAKLDGVIRHIGFRNVRNAVAHHTPASIWERANG